MLASLGKDPTDDYLEAMMNEAPGPINFTMFLTLFGERLQAGLIYIVTKELEYSNHVADILIICLIEGPHYLPQNL